jgi:hypothetical protein
MKGLKPSSSKRKLVFKVNQRKLVFKVNHHPSKKDGV